MRNGYLSCYDVTGLTSEELGVISLRCNNHWAKRAFICREEDLSFSRMQAIFSCFNPERMSYGYKSISVEMYLRNQDFSSSRILAIIKEFKDTCLDLA